VTDERERRLRELLAAPSAAAPDEIRALIRAEIAVVRVDLSIGCGDALYGLCGLLYLIGEPADAALIHEAKSLNHDAGAMIDRDFLTMRSDRATVLAAIPPALARAVSAAFDDADRRSPAEIEAGLRRYFDIPGDAPA
jgi:hypothetical protein